MVLLIIVGDELGGLLYMVSVLGEIGFLMWARNMKGKLTTWNYKEITEVRSVDR